MVSFVNVMNNGLLRASLPPGPERRKHGITAYNHPLNLTKEQLTEVTMLVHCCGEFKFTSCARCISSVYVRGKIRVDLNSVHCC